MLELFHHPNFVSQASLIALEEAQARYRVTTVDFAAGEDRSPEFRAINPCGQVPALRLPNGTVITETVAIMCFLAQEYPDLALAPCDPRAYVAWISIMARMASTYHPTFTAIVRPDMKVDDEAARPKLQATARTHYSKYLSELDLRLSRSLWLIGEKHSLADSYAFVFYEWGARADFPMHEYRHFSLWHDRMLQRPPVQRAMEFEHR